MQTVSSSYYPHHGHHPHPSDYDPHLHGLKRHYLTLLPPPQVIEICLAFEPHAPVHIKSSIWPLDLNGAITALQAHRAPPASGSDAQSENPFKSPLTGQSHPMDTSVHTPQPTHTAASAADQLPSRPTPQPGGEPVTTFQPPTQATASATPVIYQPPYPHQAYGYTQPQTAYPHAPYYPPAGQSHPSYPYSPYHLPANYPQTHPNAVFANGHPSHPQDPPQTSTEDLPSYEEMIVEALLDSGDPEGCAPKDLFSTMASRYPLQTNFRPSASQALQKAFKRGRLEKSSGGKYRLNASWEGGNTSRRTTRRPQTHAQTATLMQHSQTTLSHSPFTHAPLARQLTAPIHSPGPSQQPPVYYGHPPPIAYPPASTTVEEDICEGSDAWEAAQTILKAINFGGLLQLPEDEKTTAISKDEPVAVLTNPDTIPPPVLPVSTPGIERAELQAQLALLAAQLADIAQAGEGIAGAD